MNYLRGHAIEQKGREWVFSDTKESVSRTWKQRPCGYCGQHNTPEGHDACLGTLPGIMNACCGHGHENPYIQLMDGYCVRGENALRIIKILITDDEADQYVLRQAEQVRRDRTQVMSANRGCD